MSGWVGVRGWAGVKKDGSRREGVGERVLSKTDYVSAWGGY